MSRIVTTFSMQNQTTASCLHGMVAREPRQIESVLVDLQRSCLLGRVLDVGCGSGQLVRALIAAGADAVGVDGDPAAINLAERKLPGRCRVQTGWKLDYPDESFDSVTALGVPADQAAATSRWVDEVARVARRHVYLRASCCDAAGRRTASAESVRCLWEQRFFQAGFRRHPAVVRVVGYDGLELEGDEVVVLLEKIESGPRAAYPLTRLAAERDLHMDMLRESGRRSDAHLQRYEFASSFVRPGAVVLDVACGLGYGAAVVGSTGRARSVLGVDNSEYAVEYARAMYGGVAPEVRFVVGDAHRLDGVPDNSVDLVVSFETLEHLADPQLFLTHVQRVLAPGGRFIGSIPNEWLDEAGRDPNPHHLHVFDAARLVALFSGTMWVESLWAQTAGGGMKHLARAVRAWWWVDPGKAVGVSAEWWIVVAVKDPATGAALPYVERVYASPAGAFRPTCVSFADAYENPWLRHAMVTVGMRIGDPGLLRVLCERVVATAGAGSVDRGAALCVRGYQLLEDADLESDAVHQWLVEVNRWLGADGGSPHRFRWRVSLEFVAGRLLLAAGARAEARSWFERCAGRNALEFSPLLATKTVEAAYIAGLLHACDGNLHGARAAWKAGVEAAGAAMHGDWREVTGPEDHPFSFGPRELASVLDNAARCAAGLEALATWREAPGRMAEILLFDSRPDQQRFRAVDLARKQDTREAGLKAERDHALALWTEARADLLWSRIVTWPMAGTAHATRPRVIWGAGSGGRRTFALLRRAGSGIEAFIDSDPSKAGSFVEGVRIESPDALKQPRLAESFVVIASTYADEISARLERDGLVRERDFLAVDFGAVAALERRFAATSDEKPR